MAGLLLQAGTPTRVFPLAETPSAHTHTHAHTRARTYTCAHTLGRRDGRAPGEPAPSWLAAICRPACLQREHTLSYSGLPLRPLIPERSRHTLERDPHSLSFHTQKIVCPCVCRKNNSDKHKWDLCWLGHLSTRDVGAIFQVEETVSHTHAHMRVHTLRHMPTGAARPSVSLHPQKAGPSLGFLAPAHCFQIQIFFS